MPVSTPRLSTRFDLLAAGEEPRHYERALRFGTAAEALSFLERIPLTASARELLVSCLGAEMGFAVSRMTDRDIRSAVAPRIASGELRVVEVRTPAAPLTYRGTAFRVLRGTERPRAGESLQWFGDRDTAHRFVQRLHDDPWSRRGIEEAARQSTGAVAGDEVGQVLRGFADQLAAGRARIVRLSSAPAVLPAPSSPLTRVALAAAERAPAATGRRLQLAEIPDVMEHKLCWPTAAALMRRWFTHPSHVMPPAVKRGETDPRTLLPSRIDERIVRMDWALGFPRPRVAYEALRRGSWNTPNGRNLLAQRIQAARAQGRIQQQVWRFGNLQLPAKVLDWTCQTNVSPLDSDAANDPLDDWYGAMGRATMKVATSGVVTQLAPNRVRILVDQIGIYIRDTYDFVDDRLISQPLGFWNSQGVTRDRTAGNLWFDVETRQRYAPGNRGQAAPECTATQGSAGSPPGATYRVQNKHFSEYRGTHRMGGDFIVFSDVKVERLRVPVTIELNI
jgi:hypothetical protein